MTFMTDLCIACYMRKRISIFPCFVLQYVPYFLTKISVYPPRLGILAVNFFFPFADFRSHQKKGEIYTYRTEYRTYVDNTMYIRE